MSSPLPLTPADMSHAMLVAVLMHNGGSLELPASAFDGDALTGPDGAWHAVGMEPRPDGTIRLVVHPRPDGDAAGIMTRPVVWTCPACRADGNREAVCSRCDAPRPD
jgi:hypothetical protein